LIKVSPYFYYYITEIQKFLISLAHIWLPETKKKTGLVRESDSDYMTKPLERKEGAEIYDRRSESI
jgi:hypothetical protein